MKNAALIFCMIFSAGLAPHATAQTLRNYSVAIPGVLGRAGTTHQKPFSDDTLVELCNQGYTLAIYLYAGATSHEVTCDGGRKITYLSLPNWQNPASVLARIDAEAGGGGKTLVHCWNGVHATGFVVAAAMTKFCGFSGVQAAALFRADVPPGSLPQASIDKLAGILSGLPTGAHVNPGCPRGN